MGEIEDALREGIAKTPITTPNKSPRPIHNQGTSSDKEITYELRSPTTSIPALIFSAIRLHLI